MNFMEEEEFVKNFNEKIIKHKHLCIKSVDSLVFALQLINIIYETKVKVNEIRFKTEFGIFIFTEITLIENGKNI